MGLGPDDSESKGHLLILKGLLGCSLRVKIVDERCFEGLFVCIDKPVNLVLDQAVERISGLQDREVGLIMIPARHIVKVEARTQDIVRPLG